MASPSSPQSMWQNSFRSPTPSDCSDEEGDRGPRARPEEVLKRQLDLNRREDLAVPKYNPFTLAKANAKHNGGAERTERLADKSLVQQPPQPVSDRVKPNKRPMNQWKKSSGGSKITFDKIPTNIGQDISAYPILEGLERLKKRQQEQDQEQARAKVTSLRNQQNAPGKKDSGGIRPKPKARTGKVRTEPSPSQNADLGTDRVDEVETRLTAQSSHSRMSEFLLTARPTSSGTPSIRSKESDKPPLSHLKQRPSISRQVPAEAIRSGSSTRENRRGFASTGPGDIPTIGTSTAGPSENRTSAIPSKGLLPRMVQIEPHPTKQATPDAAPRFMSGSVNNAIGGPSVPQKRDSRAGAAESCLMAAAASDPASRRIDCTGGTRSPLSLASCSPSKGNLTMSASPADRLPSNGYVLSNAEVTAKQFRPHLLPRSGTTLPLHHIDARYDADEALKSSSTIAKAKARASFVAPRRTRGAMAGAAYEAREVDLDQLFQDDGFPSAARQHASHPSDRDAKPYYRPSTQDQAECPASPSWSTLPLTKRDLLKEHNQRDVALGRAQAPVKIAGKFMLPAQMLGGPHGRNPTVWRDAIEQGDAGHQHGTIAGVTARIGQRGNQRTRGSTKSGAAYEQNASTGSSPDSDLTSMITSGRVVKMDRKITLFAPSIGTMSKASQRKSVDVSCSGRPEAAEDDDDFRTRRDSNAGSEMQKLRGGHDSGREDMRPDRQARFTTPKDGQNALSGSESSASARSLEIGSSPLAQYLFRNKQHRIGFVSSVLTPGVAGDRLVSARENGNKRNVCEQVGKTPSERSIRTMPQGDLSNMYSALSYEGEPVPGKIKLQDISTGIARRYHLIRTTIERRQDTIEGQSERIWSGIGFVESGRGSSGMGTLELFSDGACTEAVMKLLAGNQDGRK